MMIYMQECDLVVLLPQNKEQRVQELNEFGEVVPPQYFSDLFSMDTKP